MAFKVEREGSGYRIRLTGDRKKIIAKTVTEITTAVEHYYGQNGHSHGTHPACPLCRVVLAARGR